MRIQPIPCPLCDAKAAASKITHAWSVFCTDDDHCGLILYGNARQSRRELVEQWNTRTPAPSSLGGSD